MGRFFTINFLFVWLMLNGFLFLGVCYDRNCFKKKYRDRACKTVELIAGGASLYASFYNYSNEDDEKMTKREIIAFFSAGAYLFCDALNFFYEVLGNSTKEEPIERELEGVDDRISELRDRRIIDVDRELIDVDRELMGVDRELIGVDRELMGV